MLANTFSGSGFFYYSVFGENEFLYGNIAQLMTANFRLVLRKSL